MAVHKQTPSEALFGNLISFGIGFGIGRGISGAGQLAGRNADNANVRGGNADVAGPSRLAYDSKGIFKSEYDPMVEHLGPARGNPTFDAEVDHIIKHVEANGGVVIIETDPTKSRMSYGPGLRPGETGTLTINKTSSISAWRHEYDHFLLDLENGYAGSRYYLENPDIMWEGEIRAYQREIDTAYEFGLESVIPRLEELKNRRKLQLLNPDVWPSYYQDG